jgi:hypothetical protein
VTREEFRPQSDPKKPAPEADDVERGFQVEFISNKTVMAWALAILGLTVLAVGVAFGLWAWLDAKSPTPARADADQPDPLDPHQRQTRLQFERDEREHLASYGWVQPERDIVHVPIERAMELLIERTNP